MKRIVSLLLGIFVAGMPLIGAAAAEEIQGFTVGYAAQAVTADLENDGIHYVAGYRNEAVATDVRDNQLVKAVYIEDTRGESVLLLSVDCVALSRMETIRLRTALSDWSAETGCRQIHVMSTHDHAGSDTLGLWGKPGCDGKNPAFMEQLRTALVETAKKAYDSRCAGQIYYGSIDTADQRIQEDTRLPAVFDSRLHSFRFVPDDSSRQTIRLLNYASHAESLDGSNSRISADFPGEAARVLAEKENSEMIWFPGAIGGLIRTRFVLINREDNCRLVGERLAEKVLSITDEVLLEPLLETASVELSIPCENPQFLLMRALGVLDQTSHSIAGSTFIDTEMSVLRLGGLTILLVPGELFPELAYGDQTGFEGACPDKAVQPLTTLFGEDMLVFGLADDEIGYIVAPDNFLLNEKKPYWDRVTDRNGEDHYEETNSLGPETADCIFRAAQRLAEQLNK